MNTILRNIGTSLRHAGLAAGREFLALVRGRRGRTLLFLVLLGGSLPSILRMSSGGVGGGPEKARVAAASVMSMARIYGRDTAHDLASHPAPLVAISILSMVLIPLMVLAAGFDTIAADRERGSLRHFLTRTSCVSLVAGRVAGLWAGAAALILVAHIVVWGALVVGGVPLAQIAGSGSRLFVACALSALPYAALTVLVSAIPGPPSRALLIGMAALTVMWLVRAVGVLPDRVATLLLPATQDATLLAARPAALLLAAGSLLVWTFCSAGLAVGLVRTRSV